MNKRPLECDTIMYISDIVIGDLGLITHMMYEGIAGKKENYFLNILFSHFIPPLCVCAEAKSVSGFC